MDIPIQTLEDTQRCARLLAKQLKSGDVLALIGPLGAGKTTFVTSMAQGLEVSSRYQVTSPTFVYCQEYPGRIPLYHMDFYRIENAKHLHELGLEEMIGGDGVAAIEWFDRFPEVATKDRLEIHFHFLPSGDRTLQVKAVGERSKKLMQDWKVNL